MAASANASSPSGPCIVRLEDRAPELEVDGTYIALVGHVAGPELATLDLMRPHLWTLEGLLHDVPSHRVQG